MAAFVFIMLLFLAIETSPIIAKLYLQREYDYKLEDLETALKATIEQDKYQRTLLVKLAPRCTTKSRYS
jgi:hypothetical protein